MLTERICPLCGHRLLIRTSRGIGTFREQRRECERCEYRDCALVRPEKIFSVRIVSTQQSSAPSLPTGQ